MKINKNFIQSLSAEWEVAYHRMNTEKNIKLGEKFWREAHSDTEEGKALLREVGKIIINKLLPNQIKAEGFDARNITVVWTGSNGATRISNAGTPQGTVNRLGERDEIPSGSCGPQMGKDDIGDK